MELVGSHTFLKSYPLRHFRWPNGFEAILLRNPISPVAAYLTLFSTGSASEAPHQRGLAHFFEHMMFRETEALADGDFDRIISEIGGVGLNAFTTYDSTAYHVSVPAAGLARVIELEAERMTRLQLLPEQIEKERGAVLGEMKMYKDMPSEQLWEALLAAAFNEHPYRHPVIGYRENVEAFSREDFASFYHEHYSPGRALVVVAGGFDEQEVLEAIDTRYGVLEAAAPAAPIPPAEPPWPESRRVELSHPKISSEYLSVAYRTPGLTHQDTPLLLLLGSLLTAGQSSPLYRKIVLDGLGTHVSATQMETELMMRSPGLLVFEVALQHGVAAEAAEEALQKVLEDYDRDGIGEADMERAHNQISLSYYSGLIGNMSLARQVGAFTLTCGDPLHGERIMESLDGLGAGELLEAIRGYLLRPAALTVVQRPGKNGGSP